MTPEERFAQVVALFTDVSGVTPPSGGRAFGSSALKVGGRIFAMLVQGRFVVKLPAGRVAALITAGDGLPFASGNGTPMREWVAFSLDGDADWPALAEEARAYVTGLR